MFVEVSVRLPNMAVGRITREKSKEAFRIGMKAAQIIDFLTLHAHPVMRQNKMKAAPGKSVSSSSLTSSVLPENVIDQLVLWESEMTRMQMQDAAVVDCSGLVGVTAEMFQELVEDLRVTRRLLWVDTTGGMVLACTPESEAAVYSFLTERIYS